MLDVGTRITSANQKWMEVPGDEDDGVDMLVEFTDEDGNGIGKGLCLQLKAGNSHLTKRKDGTEIFTIKKQRWVKTWTNQSHPVMLVIGTFPEKDEGGARGANLGLGCGNPQAIAALPPGETVLDLGTGAGFDSFLVARAVGAAGRVIGVDMTPETGREPIAGKVGAEAVAYPALREKLEAAK